MGRPWTESEIQLLGTKPGADVGRLIGRPGKAVWAKRRALGIADPPSLVRPWTDEEDQIVLSRRVGNQWNPSRIQFTPAGRDISA
jgi:hypothetical protein